MAVRKTTFALDRAQLQDILFAVSRVDDLEKIVAIGAGLPPSTSIDTVSRQIGTEAKFAPDDVKRLIGVVLTFIATREAIRGTTEDVAAGVARNLTLQPLLASRSEAIDSWKRAQERFCKIIDSVSQEHPFHVLRKVSSVLYAHQNLLTDVRIVTDLRPVFDESGKKVLHTVVSHTLIVSYNDGIRGRRIEFGLDASDLSDLLKAVERAHLKAATLQSDLKNGPWSVSLQTEG